MKLINHDHLHLSQRLYTMGRYKSHLLLAEAMAQRYCRRLSVQFDEVGHSEATTKSVFTVNLKLVSLQNHKGGSFKRIITTDPVQHHRQRDFGKIHNYTKMTEQELRKKYEEGAKNYVETHKDGEVRRMYGHHFRSFLAGAEHAHSEGKKEGWNEALDKAIIMVENNGDYTVEDGKVYISEESIIEELKKLRK